MTARTGVVLFVVAVCAVFAGAPGAWGWQTNINGAVSLNDEARAATSDPNGDVVVSGFIQNAGGGADFAVVKVSGTTGAELWRRVISGTASAPSGEVRAVAVDAAGDVVAAGAINNTGSLQDFTVVKLAGATGVELWRQVINGTASLNDTARSLRLDGAGNVVAGGELQNTGTGMDFTVVKLAGTTGAELWRRQLDGTASGTDVARSVRLDAAGDVVAGGELQNIGTGMDFMVVKLSGTTGTEVWRRQIDGTASGNDLARTLRVDSTGNVVAAGELQNIGTGLDFTVVKLAGSSGAELWRQVLNGTASGTDAAHAVRVDAAGDVIAAGELQNIGTGMDFAVVKLAGGSGAELWRRQLNGTASIDDLVRAVRVDAAGDVLAGGELQNTGTGIDFAVVKLAGSTGVPVWQRTLNGTVSGADRLHALTEDTAGDVLAAGFTTNIGTGTDFTVVKLRGTDGTDFVAPTTTTTTTPTPTTSTSSATSTSSTSTTSTLPSAQTVLGKVFLVSDPAPPSSSVPDPSRRTYLLLAKQLGSSANVVGDPVVNGATVQVIANGTNSTTQTLSMPAGAGWSPVGALGFKYKDVAGANGPVKKAIIKRTASGAFLIKVLALGSLGPGPQPHLTVVPPNTGTNGGFKLTIGGGGTYCVAFGPPVGGAVVNGADTLFKITNPSGQGCP